MFFKGIITIIMVDGVNDNAIAIAIIVVIVVVEAAVDNKNEGILDSHSFLVTSV